MVNNQSKGSPQEQNDNIPQLEEMCTTQDPLTGDQQSEAQDVEVLSDEPQEIPESPEVNIVPPVRVMRASSARNTKENKMPNIIHKPRIPEPTPEERQAWFGSRAGIIKNFGQQAQTSKNLSEGTVGSMIRFKKAKKPVYAVHNKDGSKTLVTKEEIKQLKPHVKSTPSLVFALENRNVTSIIHWRLSARYREHCRLTIQRSRRKSEGHKLRPMALLKRTSTISKLINFFFDSAILHGIEVVPYIEENDPDKTSDEFYEKVMSATTTNQAMQEAIRHDTTSLQIRAVMEEDITPWEMIATMPNICVAKHFY